MTSTPLSNDEQSPEQGPDPEFIQCLEQEAELIKEAIGDGISPMRAHARAIMWVDALVKIHAVGLDEALTDGDQNQCAVWSRDLTSLEISLAMLQNIPPLKQQQD